jgi:predicted acetyltransferase
MPLQFQYSTLTLSEDVEPLGSILDQCFLAKPGDSEAQINRLGMQNMRLIRQSEQIVGGLATIPMGQWYGGQRVPMIGIAAVGIAPQYRGTGAAIALMQHTLNELYAKGIPISVLYPATQRLYRKAGYEQGGNRCSWEIPTASIQIREQPLPLQPVVPSNLEVFYDLYQKQAKLINGNLDRHPFIWQKIIPPFENEGVYAYLIGTGEHSQGYAILSQHHQQESSVLLVRDWVALTPAAAQSFWSFIANHRSTIEKVRWAGAVIDVLKLLLPEQTTTIKSMKTWLLRVVDVAKALEKRGYPSGLQAELHLEVQDDLIAENNGRFILSVSHGQGEVTKGGTGELKLHIRELAPLYTSLFTPYQLQLTGRLEATETALDTAAQLFAGVSPSMPDSF